MKKTLIIIIIAVVVLGGGAAAYFLLIAPGADAEPPEVRVFYTPGEYIVTNMQGNQTAMIKVTPVLELSEEGHDEELEKFQSVIRDTILFIVRGHTEKELRTVDIKSTLVPELVNSIKEATGIEYIRTIHFYDFVIQ